MVVGGRRWSLRNGWLAWFVVGMVYGWHGLWLAWFVVGMVCGWGDWWMGLGCIVGVVGCLWLGVRVVRRPHHAML